MVQTHTLAVVLSARSRIRALAHMRAFCYLVELAAGPHHPELSSAYHNMGRAYQDLGSAIMALR